MVTSDACTRPNMSNCAKLKCECLNPEYFACALGIVVERVSLEEQGVMEREAIVGDEMDTALNVNDYSEVRITF